MKIKNTNHQPANQTAAAADTTTNTIPPSAPAAPANSAEWHQILASLPLDHAHRLHFINEQCWLLFAQAAISARYLLAKCTGDNPGDVRLADVIRLMTFSHKLARDLLATPKPQDNPKAEDNLEDFVHRIYNSQEVKDSPPAPASDHQVPIPAPPPESAIPAPAPEPNLSTADPKLLPVPQDAGDNHSEPASAPVTSETPPADPNPTPASSTPAAEPSDASTAPTEPPPAQPVPDNTEPEPASTRRRSSTYSKYLVWENGRAVVRFPEPNPKAAEELRRIIKETKW